MSDSLRARIERGESGDDLTELIARAYATDWDSADDSQRIWWRLKSLDVREAIEASGFVVVPIDDKQLRELMRRVNKARNFPTNTCPASRHLHMIANNLARGKPYPMLDEEPEHCAETMLAVLESLWTLRTKTGWPDNTSEQAARDDVARADPEPGR